MYDTVKFRKKLKDVWYASSSSMIVPVYDEYLL